MFGSPRPGMTTFREWLAGRGPTQEELSKYIGGQGEWWNPEFKATVDEGDYVLRKAVCALSNARGGEVFLGVSDDRRLVGSRLTGQKIKQVLQQERAHPGVWYVVDLTLPVSSIMPIPLEPTRGFAYVLEVTPVGLPVFLREESGELSLYLREGESSVKANSFRALEWSRNLTREQILRTCSLELKTLSRTVGEMNVGLSADLGLTLPYLSSRLEDGTFYRYLTDEDAIFILGRSKGGGYEGGVVQDLFEARHRVQQVLSRDIVSAASYEEVRNILRNANEQLSHRAESFRNYLKRQNIAVD